VTRSAASCASATLSAWLKQQGRPHAEEGAKDDEVIVIAGKGHETYQVVGDQVIHFDDREEAELALKKRTQKAATKISSN